MYADCDLYLEGEPSRHLDQKGVKLFFVPFLRLKIGCMGKLLRNMEPERRSSSARSEATGNDQTPLMRLVTMIAFICLLPFFYLVWLRGNSMAV